MNWNQTGPSTRNAATARDAVSTRNATPTRVAPNDHSPSPVTPNTTARDEGARRPSRYVTAPTIFGVSLLCLGIAVVGCGTDDGPPSDGPRVEARAAQAMEALAESSVPAAGTPGQVPPESEPRVSTVAPPPATTMAVATTVDYAEGERLYRERRYGEAAEMFRAYLETHPQNTGANVMLGLSLWKSGSPAEAEEPLRAALERDPAHVKAGLNLVRVLLDLNRAREATDVAEMMTAAHPDLAEAYRLLGRARHEGGDSDGAVLAYREALRRDPHDVWSMNNLGMLHIEQGRYEEALPPLARAVELRGDSPVFRNNLGAALERSGFLREAVRSYRAAVEADSTYTRAAASLARLEPLVPAQSREPFDFDRAAATFESWIAEPDHAEAQAPPPGIDPE